MVFPCTIYATHLWKLACKAEPGMRLHLNRDLCFNNMISGELPKSPYPRYFTDEEGNRVVCRNTGRKVQAWDPKKLVWVDVNMHGMIY